MEAPVHIDVVDDNRAAGSQNAPSPLQLKARVVRRVQTVVDEEVDLSERSK